MFALTWPLYAQLGLFVGYGLAVAALVMTGVTQGRAGIRNLLARFLIWRVGVRWYLIVLLGPVLLNLAAIAVFAASRGAVPNFDNIEAYRIFGRSNGVWLLVIPFFLVDAFTNGEEIAWRGYALPRLQARSSALVSSLVVGLFWGLWHLPRFWSPVGHNEFAFCLLHNLAAAVLFTWVFNSTNGSLLLVTLFHAAGNTAYVFLPVNPAAGDLALRITVVSVEIAAACMVLLFTRPESLSPKPAVRVAT